MALGFLNNCSYFVPLVKYFKYLMLTIKHPYPSKAPNIWPTKYIGICMRGMFPSVAAATVTIGFICEPEICPNTCNKNRITIYLLIIEL